MRKNYGIARTMNLLISMGYKIFLHEDAAMMAPEAAREFYKAYGLDALREAKVLIPVRGTGVELKQQINRGAGAQVDAKKILFVSYDEISAAGFEKSEKLLLDPDVLGTTSQKRVSATFPTVSVCLRCKDRPPSKS